MNYIKILKAMKILLNKTLFLCMLFLFIGIFIGVLGNTKPQIGNNLSVSTDKKQQTFSTEVRAGQHKLINQLYECNAGKLESTKEVGTLEKDLNNLIKQKINSKMVNNVSVYYRDLNTGPNFGINEKELFAPSSLLKVPVMIAFFNKAEENPNVLNKKVTFTTDLSGPALLPQNYKPENPIRKGETYTISELIEKMIIESDNNALSLLQEQIGNKELDQVTLDLEIPTANSLNPDNLLRVKDYSTLFRVLYNASYLDKQYSEKALEILSKVNFKTGIVAAVPSNTTIAHKFGERSFDDGVKQLHDCGIIYYPNRPYLLCIMTKGTNFSNLEKTIQEISQIVYKEIDKRYK